jgi:hypothetical protein
MILGGDLAVLQAPIFDSLSFDPFTLLDDGLCINQWVLSLIQIEPITRCSASARAARTLIWVCWTETSICWP